MGNAFIEIDFYFFFQKLGPVTRASPEASCLRNTTRLPLCTPVSKMQTVPGVIDDRMDRECCEKHF